MVGTLQDPRIPRFLVFAEGGGQRNFVFVVVGGVFVYHLIGSGVAFAAMIAVTAFNGFLSWAQDAELLALYAIVGGFSTPLLVSTGENHEVALFTYLLLLDVAVLLLVALKPWSRLLCAAFAGTVFFFAAWAMQYYSSDSLGRRRFSWRASF